MQNEKNWKLANEMPQNVSEAFPEMNPAIVQLLFNRGIETQDKVDEFFNPDYKTDIHDPFLFRDMEGAVKRIMRGIENKEKIIVYGDYDVDGITGATIVQKTLERLGGSDIHIHLPHREKEGYGLNSNAVDEFIKAKASLLITVDCGVANVDEVARAKKGGLDVIIIDHHQPKNDLPNADFIIHCDLPGEKYPFKALSGGATAFKVAQALLKRSEEASEAFEKWLLDLVALSTVADMMPLLGENRTLLTYGLMVLNKTGRIGLRALIEKIGKPLGKLTADDIGWKIAPRLNAAGRMDHASAAFELITTEDEKEARELAQMIHQQNAERQKQTEGMIKEIKDKLGDTVPLKGIREISPDWPVSLLGLAAGRIANTYARPTYIMTEKEDEVMGSARSFAGVNLLDILNEIHEKVEIKRFGGHAQACGFTIDKDKLEEFQKEFDRVTTDLLKDKDMRPTVELEAEIGLKDVDWQFMDRLEKFEPFGKENPKPLFLIKNLEVKSVDLVGNGEKHLKMLIADPESGAQKRAIGFGLGQEWGSELSIGTRIDIAAEIDVNEWNGNRELQVKISDLRIAQ